MNKSFSNSSMVFNPIVSDVTHGISGQSNDGCIPDSITHANTLDVQVMLSTLDNPFDPFTQFDSWLAFDKSNNYNSLEYLARIARTSDELSEADNNLAIRKAIDEIVELNISGVHKKIIKT